MTLIELKKGETGKVIEIMGGHHLHNKLDAMGIRKGVLVKKVSDIRLSGPVIVMIGNTSVAIGRGMARKIIVEKVDLNG